MQSTANDISIVVDRNLCTGCGICSAVCPVDCLDFGWRGGERVPNVDLRKCISCGNCYEVCPGRWIRGDRVDGCEYERYLGGVDQVFTTTGSDLFVDRYTASGGFVTSFLAYLLDSEFVDGILNVSLQGGDLRNATSHVITNASDLRATAGSLYFTVPLGDGLRELAEMDGRFAVVGLPCQIRGIRRLQIFSSLYRDRIKVLIGLFCGFMIGYRAAEYLLDSLKIPVSSEVRRISFRADHEGVDGFLVETDEGEYFIARSEYTSVFNRLITNKRCLMCNDMTSEEADISCGDAHGLSEEASLVISRTEEMTRLIRAAEEDGYISVRRILSRSHVYCSQERILKYKKETIDGRLKVMKLLNAYIPEISGGSLLSSNTYQNIGAFMYVMNCYVTRIKLLRAILPLVCVNDFDTTRARI